MVQYGEWHGICLLGSILTGFQAGVVSEWASDGQHFLLEHFDTIHNSPCHIYHSALPLSPSSSWLYKHYIRQASPMVKIVKGLPVGWGVCSRTTQLSSSSSALSHHGNSIAAGSWSGDIIILNAITGSQSAVLSEHTGVVYCIIFSSDVASLVSGSSDKTVKFWDVQTGGVVKTFFGHKERVLSVSISADCTTIASGSSDYTICLWNIHTGVCYHTIQQQKDVFCVMFSLKDPQYLISISGGKVWKWDANGHQIKPLFDGLHVSFSSDGTQFVSCHGRIITVHNSNSGATVAEFHITGGDAYRCSFSPDGGLVAVAAGNAAYCWNITNSKPHLVETLIGHTRDITSLVFSSPTTLISISWDKSVKFWQIGAQSADPAAIEPKSTSPTTIISATVDKLAKFWQIGAKSTDPAVTDLESTPLNSAPIMSITLQSEDGIVITSDSDGVVKTWDISTDTHKASFQTPAKDYKRDARLINDRLILAWYANQKVCAWDIEGEKILWEIEVWNTASDLRISGDGSKIIHLSGSSIQAWSIWSGKAVGKVEYRYSGSFGSLTVDGSKVWAYLPQSKYQGWDFGTSGSTPTKLPDMPTLSNGTILWDPRQGRIKNAVTGAVIFQLSRRFANPADVQCDGSYLVAGYESGEILILNLKYAIH